MRLKTVVYLLMVIGVLHSSALAEITEGMVLMLKMPATAKTGPLYIKYLSSGMMVKVVEQARYARFSPDGHRIALTLGHGNHRRIHTINVDGTGLKELPIRCESGLAWCTDGFIYNSFFERIMPDGDTIESQVYQFQGGMEKAGGQGTLGDRIGVFHMSLDGTKAGGSVTATSGGVNFVCVDLIAKRQWHASSPCLGALSCGGEFFSQSNAGHQYFRLLPWGMEYQEYSNGSSHYGCEGTPFPGWCPEQDLGIIAFKHVLNTACTTDTNGARFDVVNPPRWSSTDPYVYLASTVNRSPDEAPFDCHGAFLIDVSQSMEWDKMTYTKVASTEYCIVDFHRSEIQCGSAGSDYIMPALLTFEALGNGSELPAAQSVTLTSTRLLPDTPMVSGIPAWLTVRPQKTSDTSWVLTNALVDGSLPDKGEYERVISVLPAGGGTMQSYKVLLQVGGPTQYITVEQPGGSEHYNQGDTLEVAFTADPSIPSVTVALSLDSGETWTEISMKSLPPEPGLFSFVIPGQIFAGGQMVSTISSSCIIRVREYPDGYEALSPVFSIRSPAAAGGPAVCNRAMSALRVSINRVEGVLSIHSAHGGVARLFDIRGGLLHTVALRRGHQTVALAPYGCSLIVLRVDYAEGRTDIVRFTSMNANSSKEHR